MTATSQVPAIELIGIDKKFGAVHANKNINLTVAKGSIHGIIGENGAGKSTLMSILYGFYQADHGDIVIDGKTIKIRDPNAAIAAGQPADINDEMAQLQMALEPPLDTSLVYGHFQQILSTGDHAPGNDGVLLVLTIIHVVLLPILLMVARKATRHTQ